MRDEKTNPTQAYSSSEAIQAEEAEQEDLSKAAGSSATEPQESAEDRYYLGKLNRHWYRRCLDELDAKLKEAGADPGVSAVKNLCDRVITAFLTAVTGQAPDSNRPQFPVDRAYYIPFQGDGAERFNFAKPYYQVLNQTADERETNLKESLWSFLPWFSGLDKKQESTVGLRPFEANLTHRVRISRKKSVASGGKTTLTLSNLLREPVTNAEDMKAEDGEIQKICDVSNDQSRPKGLVLRKSLLLRGDQDDLITHVFNRTQDVESFRQKLREALVSLFKVYRDAPGNPSVKLVLLNHFQVIRWLARLAEPPNRELHDEGLTRSKQVVLGQEDADFREIMPLLVDPLIHDYFLTTNPDVDKLPSNARQALIQLKCWIKTKLGLELSPDEDASEVPLEVLRDQVQFLGTGTPFTEAVEKEWTVAVDEKDSIRREKVEIVEKYLVEFQSHLDSFKRYFLRGDVESRIEREIEASISDDRRRAGSTEESFLWVCPDFHDPNTALPEELPLDKMTADKIREDLRKVTLPYQDFFRRFELLCLKEGTDERDAPQTLDNKYVDQIDNYWITRGDAGRVERIYASFDSEYEGRVMGAKLVGVDLPSTRWISNADMKNPRPQTIFLRVKISDTQNQPFINGLFLFTVDHDEHLLKQKDRDDLQEDVEDLLAFAKVFFFRIRDHIYSLDRARQSAEINLLNQHLYDIRLTDLVRRMDLRIKSSKYSITAGDIWSKLIYEILNNYAYSLIDKPDPDTVRIETFQFDRLLIIPLAEVKSNQDRRDAERHGYQLPFYHFQTIYLERRNGRINGEQYALLRPFLSSIDNEANRFTQRSYQQVWGSGDDQEILKEYLEKHYVGALVPDDDPDEHASRASDKPASYVTRISPEDDGSLWANGLIESFWKRNRGKRKLWRDFLLSLTEDYHTLLKETLVSAKLRQLQVWFFFQFGILQSILSWLSENGRLDELNSIRDDYDHQFALKFDKSLTSDERRDLNVLRLARGIGSDPFETLADRNRERHLAEDPLQAVTFSDYLLRGKDESGEPTNRLMIEFFHLLTLHTRNDKNDDIARDEQCLTWYQDMLTNPLKGNKVANVHREAGHIISDMIPRYDLIEEGEDALSMFLGVVNLEFGSDVDHRQFRCAIAMIRDFDDSKVGRIETVEESKTRIETDRRDLSLYSKSFFNRVQTFLETMRERQQVRSLSTVIPQIARNWYSHGIDGIVKALSRKLQIMMTASATLDLGKLRPEIVRCLFESMLEVLLRPERQIDDAIISMESIPFDRMLHVPLLFGDRSASVLAYARTTPAGSQISEWAPTQSPGNSSSKTEDRTYELIRQLGRHRALGATPAKNDVEIRKSLAFEPWFGQIPNQEIKKGKAPLANVKVDMSNWSNQAEQGNNMSIGNVLRPLVQNERLLDAFGLRLNRADPLQALAVAGTLFHLFCTPQELKELKRKKAENKLLHAEECCHIAEYLQGILTQRIESVELGTSSQDSTLTSVHMDREVQLMPVLADGDLKRVLESDKYLPLFPELFQAMEGGPGYKYGLGQDQGRMVKSKITYVYYSIPSPASFIENYGFDSRYRGVFCLIVDDHATDIKSEDEEIADQQDIRTFVHNCIGSFRLILEQQALYNQVLQPGVDAFVTGMLHRLKNELTIPNLTLDKVERSLQSTSKIIQNLQKELSGPLKDAKETISGLGELFQGLKGVSERNRKQMLMPLMNFSSNWLGWKFIASLCEAAKKLPDPPGSKAKAGDIKSKIDDIAIAAKDAMKEKDGGCHSLARVRQKLAELQSHLVDYLRIGDGNDRLNSDILLSFDVHRTSPLFLKGNKDLPEALNILIENAFQAAFDFLHKKTKDGTSEDPLTGLISLTCRPSQHLISGEPEEIILEIRNSSRRLTEEALKELNSPSPQMISAQQYDKVSGKAGGSGFGHFHARSTITRLCGGHIKRRKLDIIIQNDPDFEDTVLVRVNLLAAGRNPPKIVSQEDLLASISGVLEETQAVRLTRPSNDSLSPKKKYYFPGDTEVLHLFSLAQSILTADRDNIEKRAFKTLKVGICGVIKRTTRKLKSGLCEAVQDLLDGASGPVENSEDVNLLKSFLAELSDPGKVRSHSFHDLRECLRRWYTNSCEPLNKKVADYLKDNRHVEILNELRNTGDFSPMAFVLPGDKDHYDMEWKEIEPYLSPDYQNGGLEKLIEGVRAHPDNGHPEPSRRELAKALKPEHWVYQIDVAEPNTICFTIRLYDGNPGEPKVLEKDSSDADLSGQQLESTFDREMLGPAFVQYQKSLEIPVDQMAPKDHSDQQDEQSDEGNKSENTIGKMVFQRHHPSIDKKDENQISYRTVYIELNMAQDPGIDSA